MSTRCSGQGILFAALLASLSSTPDLSQGNDYSDLGFVPDSSWHHVAVSYTFGEPESIRGYVDGFPSSGAWDYGGPTTKGPVVDDDQLWIGSSMGGSAGSSFSGDMAHVALHRRVLSESRILARYEAVYPSLPPEEKVIPDEAVLVEIFEGIPDAASWAFRLPPVTESYTEPAFGLVGIRNKYSDRAILIDRTNPFLVHATGFSVLPQGPVQILLRARGAARLDTDWRERMEDMVWVLLNSPEFVHVP